MGLVCVEYRADHHPVHHVHRSHAVYPQALKAQVVTRIEEDGNLPRSDRGETEFDSPGPDEGRGRGFESCRDCSVSL